MNELLEDRYVEYRIKVRDFSEKVIQPIAVEQDEKEERYFLVH